MTSYHADPKSAQIHLDAELARTNPQAYSTVHLATIRHTDGYGGYLHIFDVTNHLKDSYVPHRVAVIRMVGGFWEVVGS